MLPRFHIPLRLEELEQPKTGQLHVEDVPGAIDEDCAAEACDGALDFLGDGPLSILDEDCLRSTYVACKGLGMLKPSAAVGLGLALCQQLCALVTSGLSELAADMGAEGLPKSDPVVVRHCNALHALAFFLSRVVEHLATRQKEAEALGVAVPKKKAVRGKAKAVAAEVEAEQGGAVVWDELRERAARALARTLAADLDGTLYASPADKTKLLRVAIVTAVRCLEDPAAAKSEALRNACTDVLCLAAAKHRYSDTTATELMHLAKGADHGPELVAAIALQAELKHEHTSLVQALITKFAEVPPEVYDDMAAKDAKAVKRVAELLEGVAQRQPAFFNGRISQLMPYFGAGQAVSLRSHLVVCLGHVMLWFHSRTNNERGNKALRTSRCSIAETLLLRVNDKAAIVRKAALDTIRNLLESQAWPRERIPLTAERAKARLQDGSWGQGAALDLLYALAVQLGTNTMDEMCLLRDIKHLEQAMEKELRDNPHLARSSGDDADGEEGAGPPERLWEEGAEGQEGAQGQGQDPSGAAGGEEQTRQRGIIEPTQLEESPAGTGGAPPGGAEAGPFGGFTYHQLELLLETTKTELYLARVLQSALPEVVAVMQDGNGAVAEKAIHFLTMCRKRCLVGADEAFRQVWHMVYASSDKVRDTVLDAFNNGVLLPPDGSSTVVRTDKEQLIDLSQRLRDLVDGASVRDMQALDELLRQAVTRSPAGDEPMIPDAVLRHLIRDLPKVVKEAMSAMNGDVAAIFNKNRQQKFPEGMTAEEYLKKLRIAAAMTSVLCAAICRHRPEMFMAEDNPTALVHTLSYAHETLKDPLLTRNLCIILGDMAPVMRRAGGRPMGHSGANPTGREVGWVLPRLFEVLLDTVHLPEAGWYGAAQAAVDGVYKLAAVPYRVLQPLLARLAQQVQGRDMERCSAVALSRALFVAGCVVTHQMALTDGLAKRVRAERDAREKAAMEALKAGGREGQENADVSSQLGTSQAADAQLEGLQSALDAELASGRSALGAWAALAQGVCTLLLGPWSEAAWAAAHGQAAAGSGSEGAAGAGGGGGAAAAAAALGVRQTLAGSAVGAMTRLMLLDEAYCDKCTGLFFTLLAQPTDNGGRHVPPAVRCDMLAALGDLYRRHPNAMEPWSDRVFGCLRGDPDQGVRTTCLRVLSHLVVSSIIKPKGHMAAVAQCLVREEGGRLPAAPGEEQGAAEQPADAAAGAEGAGKTGGRGKARGGKARGRGRRAEEQEEEDGDGDEEGSEGGEEEEEEDTEVEPMEEDGEGLEGDDGARRKGGKARGGKKGASGRRGKPAPGAGADAGPDAGAAPPAAPAAAPAPADAPAPAVEWWDDPPQLAKALFNALGSKQLKGGGNLVYQYLPEIISALIRVQGLPARHYLYIMTQLVGYVKADKLGDSLKARLCERFENVVAPAAAAAAAASPAGGAQQEAAEAVPQPRQPQVRDFDAEVAAEEAAAAAHAGVVREWRSVADVLPLLGYSEKGLRGVVERLRSYKHTLGDAHVYHVFKGLAADGRKAGREESLRALVAEWEAQLDEAHAALQQEARERDREREEARRERAAARAEAEAANRAAVHEEAEAAAEAQGRGAAAEAAESEGIEDEAMEGEEEEMEDADDGEELEEAVDQEAEQESAGRRELGAAGAGGRAAGAEEAEREETVYTACEGDEEMLLDDAQGGVDGRAGEAERLEAVAEEQGAEEGQEEGAEGYASADEQEGAEAEEEGEGAEDAEGEAEEEAFDSLAGSQEGEEDGAYHSGEGADDEEEQSEEEDEGEDEPAMDMEWEEGGAATPATQRTRRGAATPLRGHLGAAGSAAGTPGGPTPMAITPGPAGTPLGARAGGNGDGDDMAWSPAPSGMAAGASPSPVLAVRTQLPNSAHDAFPGFNLGGMAGAGGAGGSSALRGVVIKPEQGLAGAAGRWGQVHVKPEPAGTMLGPIGPPQQQQAHQVKQEQAAAGGGRRGRIKPDPEGYGYRG